MIAVYVIVVNKTVAGWIISEPNWCCTLSRCICRFFNIPMHVLPKISTSSEIYGHLCDTVLAGVPISGVSDKIIVLIFNFSYKVCSGILFHWCSVYVTCIQPFENFITFCKVTLAKALYLGSMGHRFNSQFTFMMRCSLAV